MRSHSNRSPSSSPDPLTGSTPTSIYKRVTLYDRVSPSSKEEEKLQPGDSHDTRTFVRLWRNQGKVARYCSYDERYMLQHFAMSAWLLQSYVDAFTGRDRFHASQWDVLAYIRDNEQEMNSTKNPIDEYPVQANGAHATQRMALAIVQMYRNIQDHDSKISPHQQNEAERAFATLTDKTPPHITNINNLQFPQLGPFPENGEGTLEGYNRCYNLIMHVHFSITNGGWKTRFGKLRRKHSKKISDDMIPHWMRVGQAGNTRVLQQDPPQKSFREVTVAWNPYAEVPWARELLASLEKRGIVDELQSTNNIRIRPLHTAEEVRDLIRHKFNLQQLRAQIQTLITTPNGTSVMDDDWAEIQGEIFGTHIRETNLRMTLRKAKHSEDIFEA